MEECLPKQRLYDDGVTELIRWAADVTRGRSPILDIGCGRGYLALALEDSEIHGVEIDSERAAEARTRYKRVYETDIDQLLDSQVEDCYEAAICIDALEHLANPEATLSNLRSIMGSQSILVAAIPNIAHISSRKRLLLGKWNYTDMGMLDRTHLRFFTYDTAQELVRNAGFGILDVQVRNSFPRLLQPIAPLLKDKWPNLFGYHVLITAEVGR